MGEVETVYTVSPMILVVVSSPAIVLGTIVAPVATVSLVGTLLMSLGAG
jgi:hypothetical protein